MEDIIKFAVAFFACGFVSSGALWSFIDAAASTKYICSESSDSLILASRAMDWFQAATAIWTLYLVYLQYCKSISAEKRKTNSALSITVLGAYTIVHILTHISLRGHVCQNVGCVTSESAELARSGVNIVPYITEVLGMMDLESVNQNIWACNGRINPDFFVMPKNACPEKIAEVCPSSAFSAQDAPTQPYNCMIYACNDLVPGNVRRYTMSMAGLVFQLVICAYLFSVEGGDGHELAPIIEMAADYSDGSQVNTLSKQRNPPATAPPMSKELILADKTANVAAAAAAATRDAPDAFPAQTIRRRTMSTSHFRPKETLQF